MFELMMIVYFFTICVMVIGSLYFVSDYVGKKIPGIIDVLSFFEKYKYSYVVFAVISLVVAILKLIFIVGTVEAGEYRFLPVLGDLIPALSCAIIGFLMIFESQDKNLINVDTIIVDDEDDDFEEESVIEDDTVIGKVKGFSKTYRKIFGFVILGLSFFHLFFPWLPLL